MAASGTDLFRKKANNFSTTLSGGILAADTSAPLTAVTGLPTDTAVDLVIDRVDTNGTQTPTKREYVKGVVSGSTIASLTRGLGNSTALAHSTGAVVEMVDTSDTHNDLVTALLNVHNQVDGSLKTGSVTSTVLASNSVTSGAIATSAVGTAQLADGSATPVKWTNPYKFSAYASGATTLAAGTGGSFGAFTKVVFATEVFDNNSNFDNSTTSRYTAAVAGTYLFTAKVETFIGNGIVFQTQLQKNGTAIATSPQSFNTSGGSNNIGTLIAKQVQLAIGDYVEVFAHMNQTTTSTTNVGADVTYFDGHLVSQT